MRPTIRALTIAVMVLAPLAAPTAEPAKLALEMYGNLDGRGFAMAECGKPVYGFRLTAQVDKDGTGAGTLTLDPTPPLVDEFGNPATINGLPAVKLDITLKFLKKKNFQYGGVNGRPLVDVETRLFEITGPKVTSRLTLAVDGPEKWSHGRLILADKEGKERLADGVREPPRLLEPCHPGCFPAGTLIQTPAGARAVEDVRAGDVVTTIGADGKTGKGKVGSVFVTDNRLIQVQTDAGMLTTTTTQPLALSGGGLKGAGDLKPGDRIDTWDGKQRKSAKVTTVADTGRQARVYNVVLGDPVLFVAGGFLARSKPPAPAADAK